jgi:transcription elongation factor Elf1
LTIESVNPAEYTARAVIWKNSVTISDTYRCPCCDSQDLTSVQNTAMDSELLECQNCLRAYEVKYGPDGKVRLVAV